MKPYLFILPNRKKSALSLFFCCIWATSIAQSYSIDWHKIAGGGGTSTNGQYSVSGTIGQHDASGPLTNAQYSVTGGFWSLVQVVQTPGAPTLFISHSGNTVIVSWPATGSYTLQQNINLGSESWEKSGYDVTTADGTNRITIDSSSGNIFFRISQP